VLSPSILYGGEYYLSAGLDIVHDYVFYRSPAPPRDIGRAITTVTQAKFSSRPDVQYDGLLRRVKLNKCVVHCTAGGGSIWSKLRASWVNKYAAGGADNVYPTHFVIDAKGNIIQVADVANILNHAPVMQIPGESAWDGAINATAIGIELIIPTGKDAEAGLDISPKIKRGPADRVAKDYLEAYEAGLNRKGHEPSYTAYIMASAKDIKEGFVAPTSRGKSSISMGLTYGPSLAQEYAMSVLIGALHKLFDFPLVFPAAPASAKLQTGLPVGSMASDIVAIGSNIPGITKEVAQRLIDKDAYVFYRAHDAKTARAIYTNKEVGIVAHMQVERNRFDPFGLDFKAVSDRAGDLAKSVFKDLIPVYKPWQVLDDRVLTEYKVE
jgi:hypothetical protein